MQACRRNVVIGVLVLLLMLGEAPALAAQGVTLGTPVAPPDTPTPTATIAPSPTSMPAFHSETPSGAPVETPTADVVPVSASTPTSEPTEPEEPSLTASGASDATNVDAMDAQGRVYVELWARSAYDGVVPDGIDVCLVGEALEAPRCGQTSQAENPSGSVSYQGFHFADVPIGTYVVTLANVPGIGSVTHELGVTLTSGSAIGRASFDLSALHPSGSGSLVVTVEPGGPIGVESPVTWGWLSLELPGRYQYVQHDLTGLGAASTFTWASLPAGTYRLTANIYPYQAIEMDVTLADGDVHEVTIALANLQEHPLEITYVVEGFGGAAGEWRFAFTSVPNAKPIVSILPFDPLAVEGFGTLAPTVGNPSLLSFFPADPDIGSGSEHTFTIPTSGGDGSVTIVYGDSYWWPGDGAIVQGNVALPWFADPAAAGTLVCLVEASGGEVCQPLATTGPRERYTQVYWPYSFADVPDGTYHLEVRGIPRHDDVVSDETITVVAREPGKGFPVAGYPFISLEEAAFHDVAVDIDPGSVPAGSVVCLTGDAYESCQSAASGETSLVAISALRSTTSASRIVFDGVPAGVWRLVVRPPGYEEVEIGRVNVIGDGEVITSTVLGVVFDPVEVPPLTPDVLVPLTAELTLEVRFCPPSMLDMGKCTGRVPQVEGTQVVFTVTGGEDDVQTVSAPIAWQEKASQGSVSIMLTKNREYTVCQQPVDGYSPSPGECVDVYLDGDGATVQVNNIKQP